jgi:NAD(P)-dependent dehydrogenase (short-subunit alcohol dehydrogenase family)
MRNQPPHDPQTSQNPVTAGTTDPVLGARPILERFGLAGRTALVTGAGQGIGRALAFALGEAGAAVAVADIVDAKAVAVAEELRAHGITALPIQADVTDPASVNGMIARVREAWGTLTIAVNNAGVSTWEDSEKLSDEQWRRVLDVNLNGVFWCCRAEAALMLDAGYGKIVNTASMSGSIVNRPQNQAAYNTSKAGVIHLTRSLAAEWADRGIRVNCISPGYTMTRLLAELIATPEGKDKLDRWIDLIPMRRLCAVTDLQGGVVYLASQASDMVTGHDLVIDGGYSCW